MAWKSGYEYRRKIVIGGVTGAGTNYQIRVAIGESVGSASDDFHLSGLSLDFPSERGDGGDLCFTSDGGVTELSFWVDTVSGSSPNRTAVVWVKVGDNLNSDVDIYCYYGNASASNLSDGSATFIVFDDFTGVSIDAAWNTTIGASGVLSLDLDNLYFFSSTEPVVASRTFSNTGSVAIICERKAMSTNAGNERYFRVQNSSNQDLAILLFWDTSTSRGYRWYPESGSEQIVRFWDTDKFYREEIIIYDDHKQTIMVDDEIIANRVNLMSARSGPAVTMVFASTFSNATMRLDVVMVRKVIVEEPQISSVFYPESFTDHTPVSPEPEPVRYDEILENGKVFYSDVLNHHLERRLLKRQKVRNNVRRNSLVVFDSTNNIWGNAAMKIPQGLYIGSGIIVIQGVVKLSGLTPNKFYWMRLDGSMTIRSRESYKKTKVGYALSEELFLVDIDCGEL